MRSERYRSQSGLVQDPRAAAGDALAGNRRRPHNGSPPCDLGVDRCARSRHGWRTRRLRRLRRCARRSNPCLRLERGVSRIPRRTGSSRVVLSWLLGGLVGSYRVLFRSRFAATCVAKPLPCRGMEKHPASRAHDRPPPLRSCWRANASDRRIVSIVCSGASIGTKCPILGRSDSS